MQAARTYKMYHLTLQLGVNNAYVYFNDELVHTHDYYYFDATLDSTVISCGSEEYINTHAHIHTRTHTCPYP